MRSASRRGSGGLKTDLIAFPDQSHGHRLVHEAVCPIGGIFRPPRPFESALVPISRVLHTVKRVDDGLLLLVIERVGLTKHHILEYLRLRLCDEREVTR